jgi:hypothetical protein
MLKKVAGSEAEDIEAALEAQAVNFYESLASASKTEFAKLKDKAKALNQKTYEEMKKNPPQSKREPKKLPRAVGKSFSEDLFPLETGGPRVAGAENFAPLPDEVPIGKTETDTGITVRGAETKTMDMADSTVTRTADATQKGGTDGKEIFTETSQTETTTVVSKTDNSKVEKVEKLGWGAGFAMCSDTAGHLSGHAKMSTSSKVTITKGNRMAAVTHGLSVVYKITGYVNDDAEFTHFKIEVEGAETLTGNDRARDLGLTDDTGLSDGTGTIKYHADNGKPPYETEPDQYGHTSVVLPKIGDAVADSYNPLPGSEKLIGVIPAANSMALIELQDLMRSSQAQLRNGGCVEVECLAARNTLKPGETIDVTAVSVSKRDLDKFNARLETTSNAAPKNQLGSPAAVFVFTSDTGGGGTFLVKSTSRRGIGLGMLEFGKEGKNDLDKDKCDGNWHGTIEIRRTFEDVQKEVTKPGDQKSDLQLSGWKEMINRQKYDGTVRIENVQLATPGAWVLNAAFDMGGNWYYLDHGFFTTPNECGWYVKKTIKEDNGMEKREEGGGSGVTDVTIQINGDEYRGNTGIPEMKGTYTSRTWHQPSGYCQDGNNKPSEYNKSGETSFTKVAISFEGKIDPSNPDVLTGTKTTTSEDGKETIVITWSIKRCTPVKTKPPVKRK